VSTSPLLTLLVIPTVYETLADARDWMGAKLGVSRAHAQGSKGSSGAKGSEGPVHGVLEPGRTH